MKKNVTFIFLLLNFVAFSQNNNAKLVDSLTYITEMPYISADFNENNNGIFWKVVQQKLEIVPVLIDKLNDTTETDAYVPNFGGKYTVADIALSALIEIIDIPVFDLAGIKFDKTGCGYCSYWNFVRKDYRNRIKFQKAVLRWYRRNKKNLIWVKSNLFTICDCRGKHLNGGHYELKK